MAKVTNLANVGESVGHAELFERFSDFLLKTRKRNLALMLIGDTQDSGLVTGDDFAIFEQELTRGMQLTRYDKLRIQSRVRCLLRSNG